MSFQHGTITGYTSGGCRCALCKKAMARYQQQRRVGNPDPQFGPTLNGPTCRRCQKTEARCARTYPCCEDCTHRFAEDEEVAS